MPEPSGVDMTKRKKTETERRNSLDVTNADEKVKVRRRIITTAICPMHSYFSCDLNFVRIELLKLTNLLSSSLRWNTDKLNDSFLPLYGPYASCTYLYWKKWISFSSWDTIRLRRTRFRSLFAWFHTTNSRTWMPDQSVIMKDLKRVSKVSGRSLFMKVLFIICLHLNVSRSMSSIRRDTMSKSNWRILSV